MVENSGGIIYMNVQQDDREGGGKVILKQKLERQSVRMGRGW
jgi:hypothetical protein